VILMTGAVHDRANFPPAAAYRALLRKPFDIDVLLGAVRGLDDG
jgi:hypothetical protein